MTTANHAATLNLLTTLKDTGISNGQMVGHDRWKAHARSLGFDDEQIAEMVDALPTAIRYEWVRIHISRAGQEWHRLTPQGRRLG